MNRNEILDQLRPEVNFETTHSSSLHEFQDKTLRPILKFQHKTIIAIYHEYINSGNILLTGKSIVQRNNLIEQHVKKNLALQSLLKGVVIALFNEKEIIFWINNKTDLNKRIQTLLIKRIQNSFEEKIEAVGTNK